MFLEGAALYGLFLTATWEGVLYLTVSGLNFRPYEIFLLVKLLLLVRRKALVLDGAALVLAIYVLSGIPGLVNSESVTDTLRTLLFLGSMVLIALVVRSAIRTYPEVLNAVAVWALVVANLVNAYGFLQYATWAAGVPISPHFGPEFYPLYRPYSVFIEPNFYGSFLASQIVILFVLWMTPVFGSLHRWCFLSALAAFPLLILNQSRGPWLGLLIAVGVFFIAEHRTLGRVSRRHVVAGAAFFLESVALVGQIYLQSPESAAALAQRAQDTVKPMQEEAARARVSEMALSLEAFLDHPLIGNGVGSWGVHLGRVGADVRTAPRNVFLAWLYEKGILGALAGVAFLFVLVSRGLSATRVRDPAIRRLTWACFGAWLAIFFTYLFTMLEISPFYWITIGLLLASSDLCVQSPGVKAKGFMKLPPRLA